MASLYDYYQAPNQSPFQFDLANNALSASDATTDAGLAQYQTLHNYATRSLPDMVNAYSSRGTVRSGWAGVMADRLKEDTGNQLAQTQMALQRQLAGLSRNSVLATMGQTY